MISYANITLGMDPELFVSKDGEVIGSEKVIPERGVPTHAHIPTHPAHIVRDGVQVELQPLPNSCRESLASNLRQAFIKLNDLLIEQGAAPVFDAVVEVKTTELESLSESSRILGCGPSRNRHNPQATVKVPDAYRKRSAGGHIHMGLPTQLKAHSERIVPLLDILVGNTSVLIDRDPNAAERRKLYGRAGEYRLPAHGLEYRTLSNYWLRSYQLTSMVLGLCRMAASIIHTDLNVGQKVLDYGQKYRLKTFKGVAAFNDNPDAFYLTEIPPDQNLEKELLSLIDLGKVIEAINTNNRDLAYENYLSIKPFILKHSSSGDADYAYPLHNENLEDFEYFLTKPMEYWFPDDPMKHWLGLNVEATGWENFLATRVSQERLARRSKWIGTKEESVR